VPTRQELLTKAEQLHDEKAGVEHCDRKYLHCCALFVQSILDAGVLLRDMEAKGVEDQSDLRSDNPG
jgi:hypothetical protein